MSAIDKLLLIADVFYGLFLKENVILKSCSVRNPESIHNMSLNYDLMSISQIKSSLYSLHILSGVVSER